MISQSASLVLLTLTLTLAVVLPNGSAWAAEPVKKANLAEVNQICPVTGKPVNPGITLVYESRTYAFADDASRSQWREARQNSLYQKLGGQPAIHAVVEAFYVKVLADDRIKHFFEDINMNKQRRAQKEFLSAAFGGPTPWVGKDLRKAHANLPGLTETHFNAVAENLQNTLTELKVKPDLIDQVMAIAASTRDDVLNRPKTAK